MPKGVRVAIHKYNLALPDKFANLFGASKQEVEQGLFTNTILSLLSRGKIDVYEAADALNCDPDDLLAPEQEKAVAKGLAEIKRGEFVTLEDLEHELDNPTVKKSSTSN